MRKRVLTPLQRSPHNIVKPVRLATDATAMLTMAAPPDHLDPPVHPVKLEPPAKKGNPDHPAETETAHRSRFRLRDAVCAPVDLSDPPDPPDPLGPTAKPVHPATLEAMEPPETLEPLEAPEPLETLGPLDPLDHPEHPAPMEPSENPDLLDPKDHLDPQARLDSQGALERTVLALLDPKELPDLLARLEAMETQDPRDLLDLLGLLERTLNIVLARAVEENDLKWRRKNVLGMLSGSLSPLSLVIPFLFVQTEKNVV